MRASRGLTSLLVLFGGLAAPGCGGGSATDMGGGGGDDAAVAPDLAWAPGGALTLDVGATFPAGTVVREVYGNTTATVKSDGTVTVTPDASGVVLLEKDGAPASPFNFRNVTTYFLVTDRFNNGDPGNDNSFGRRKDGQNEVGTWHGGDWKGLAAKLDYIAELGATAIWITPVVEQAHGWVSGGSGDFKHWAYHGYWALDFTRLDPNYGTIDDLKAVVDGAHGRGIRVLVDVVMNHPGYATGADLVEFLPEVFFDKTGAGFKTYDATANGTYGKWNDLVNYNSDSWRDGWGVDWVRAGFPYHDRPGNDELTRQVSFLPDFKTEAAGPAAAPVLLTRKKDSAFAATPNTSARQYLVKWHTDWVKQLGVDGFRCDTAKNVDLPTWRALKASGVAALEEWKKANPGKKLDDAPFWMTGEVFPHGVLKDAYYTDGGFDSIINFDFQRLLTAILQTGADLGAAATDLEAIYAGHANAIANDPSFQILSYISSHDTRLNFDYFQGNAAKQRAAGTALLLAPGGVQVFYGDESGRKAGPTASEMAQGTRSDMNWNAIDASILDHWKKVGNFRKRHAAVGAGTHARIASPAGTYAFARKFESDAVVVAITPPR